MNKFFLCLIFLLIGSTTFAQAPKWDWVKGFGGGKQNNGGRITTDIDGNIYVVGSFSSDTLYYGNSFLKRSIGFVDMFLYKLSPTGTVIWTAKSYMNTFDFCGGYTIAVDQNKNVYVGGGYDNTVNFGTSLNLTPNNFPGIYKDAFLTKYDQNGNLKWAKSFSGIADNEIHFIKIGKSGNIFIGGAYMGDSLKIDTFKLFNHDSWDEMFVSEIDSNGSIKWAKSYGGSNLDDFLAFDIDMLGNIYLTGNRFNQNQLTQFGNYFLKDGYFILKLDSIGNVVWAKNSDYSSYQRGETGNGLMCDLNNDVIVAGALRSDTAIFGQDTLLLKKNYNGNHNPEDFFIVKYSSLGNVLWAKSYGGRWYDVASDVIVDNSAIYITGFHSWDTLSLGKDTFINSNQDDDFFIAKFDSIGNAIWAKSVSGEPASEQLGVSLSLDKNDNIYCLGINGAGAYLDDSIYFDSTLLVSHSNRPYSNEVFLAKINSQTGSFINDIPLQKSDAILFPNPFSNSSTLKISSSQTLINAHLSVVDVLGREVQSFNDIHSNTINIERKNLPNGIYFYRLTQNGSLICNGKMLVE